MIAVHRSAKGNALKDLSHGALIAFNRVGRFRHLLPRKVQSVLSGGYLTLSHRMFVVRQQIINTSPSIIGITGEHEYLSSLFIRTTTEGPKIHAQGKFRRNTTDTYPNSSLLNFNILSSVVDTSPIQRQRSKLMV